MDQRLTFGQKQKPKDTARAMMKLVLIKSDLCAEMVQSPDSLEEEEN